MQVWKLLNSEIVGSLTSSFGNAVYSRASSTSILATWYDAVTLSLPLCQFELSSWFCLNARNGVFTFNMFSYSLQTYL